MVVLQHRSKFKPTGSRYISARKKRKYETGKLPTLPKIGSSKKRIDRVRGGSLKHKLIAGEIVNLADPKSKKQEKVKIKTVVENPANRHYVRRNILTKGTIIDTEKGKARITNRPGQEGHINAVLI